MSEPRRRQVDFMIVGAQKCGTSALHRFLSRHPEICMASRKEAHLFDAPEYSGSWAPEQIDRRYQPLFAHCEEGGIRGESTPIYLFLPEVAAELARYDPALRLIVLLRDPVERAISHYYMEQGRDRERFPLWLALLGEPFRLSFSRNARAWRSPLRTHAYRSRGLYSRQLRNLYRHFGRDQVLVLRQQDLRARHDETLRRVFAFLGVSEEVRIPPGVHNEGERGGNRHRLVSWLLRLSYLRERARMRALSPFTAPS